MTFQLAWLGMTVLIPPLFEVEMCAVCWNWVQFRALSLGGNTGPTRASVIICFELRHLYYPVNHLSLAVTVTVFIPHIHAQECSTVITFQGK